MAANFRLLALDKKDFDVLHAYANGDPTFLGEIEKTGKLPQAIKDRLSPDDLAKANAALSKLPSRKEAIQKYTKGQTDVANLTTADLQNRVAGLQELGGTPGNLDMETVKRALLDKLPGYGVKDNVDGVAGRIAEMTRQLGRYPNADELKQAFATDVQWSNDAGKVVDSAGSRGLGDHPLDYTTPGIIAHGFGKGEDLVTKSGYVPPELENFFNDQAARNDLSGVVEGLLRPTDTSGDVKTAQDILTDRERRRKAGEEITNFFNTAPEEIGKQRSAFYDTLRTRAKDYVSESYSPAVREQLAARGLENSGQVAASITSKYGDLFQGITDEEAQQIIDDSTFFAQQAYDKTFSDMVNSGQDVTGTIANERNTLRTKQLQDFTKKQADIESRFNLDMFRDQSRQAFDAYNKQLNAKKDAAKAEEDAALAGEVAKTGATVAIASVL